MKYLLSLIVLLVIFTGCSIHKKSHKKYNERHFQTLLCEELDGKMEYVLHDRTRVDCLTDEFAIEVDFANKWAEGVGQSLYYGYMTDKKPAIGLIVGENDARFLKRLEKVSKKLDIKIFVIEKKQYSK